MDLIRKLDKEATTKSKQVWRANSKYYAFIGTYYAELAGLNVSERKLQKPNRIKVDRERNWRKTMKKKVFFSHFDER